MPGGRIAAGQKNPSENSTAMKSEIIIAYEPDPDGTFHYYALESGYIAPPGNNLKLLFSPLLSI